MAKILNVDDDEDARESLTTFLRAAGHTVTCVPNGREALAALLADLPDVVLLDLLMPEIDGPSFLEVVRSYLRIQSLPVVVLTGLSDSPMIDRARALHVNSILVKGKATPDDIIKGTQFPDAARSRLMRDIPLGRLGTPAEVADMCVYLLSDESRFVTGAEFVIDGGLTAR